MGAAQVSVRVRRVWAVSGVPAVHADAGADAASPGLLSAGDFDPPEPDAELKAIVVELEREIFLRGAWKAFGLGAGPCYMCKSCVLEAGKCRHPHEARPAMEACGIDVYSTARRAGFEIEVVRTMDQCPNYFGLVLVD